MPPKQLIKPQALVQAWGSGNFGSNGMLPYVEAELFGGSVGHAAIELQLPANQENEDLIEQYCYKNGKKIIPVEKKTYTSEDGQQEDYYVVRFSWWPGVNFSPDLHSLDRDQSIERLGVGVEYAPAFRDLADDTRIYKGKIGKKSTTLAPTGIAHIRELENEPVKKAIVIAWLRYEKLNEKVESIEVLEKKLETKIKLLTASKKAKLTPGELLMLKNLLSAVDYQRFERTILDKAGLSKESLVAMVDAVKKQKNIINEQKIQSQRDYYDNLTKFSNQVRSEISALEVKQRSLDELNYDLQEKIHNHAIVSTSAYDLLNRNLPQWKEMLAKHFGGKITTLTEREFAFLAQCVEKQQKLIANKIITGKDEIKKIDEFHIISDMGSYLTIGLPPTDSVVLPIASDVPEDSLSNALSAKHMLQKMRELLDNTKEFDLRGKNCSETVGQILSAGCTNPGLKQLADTRAFGVFGNPQEVVNKAAKIQDYIYQNKTPNIFTRLSLFSPIARLNGALLQIIVSEKADISRLKKILAGVVLVPTSILAASSFLIRGLFNPLGAFNSCKDVMNFAWRNNSVLLKIAITVTVAPIAAMFAIPAAVQYGIIKGIVEPIKLLGDKLFGAKKEKDLGMLSRSVQQQLQAMSANVASKELEIDKQKTPTATLQSFLQALFANNKAIPHFTDVAIQQITKALASKKHEAAIIESLANYAVTLQQQDPNKFAQLHLPNPAVIRQMRGMDLYKTLCDLSLERAKTTAIKDEILSERGHHILPAATGAIRKVQQDRASILVREAGTRSKEMTVRQQESDTHDTKPKRLY